MARSGPHMRLEKDCPAPVCGVDEAGRGPWAGPVCAGAVILRPRDGQEMMLEAELRALIRPTRKEEGCLRYDLHRSAEGPGAFLLHEIWETRQHHTAHTKTDHFLRWNARKDALLASREVGFWKQIA